MSKRFKSKKRRQMMILKVIVSCVLGLLIYSMISSIFLKIKLTSSNEEFLSKLLENPLYHLNYENNSTIPEKLMEYVNEIKLKEPISILREFFHFDEDITITTSSDEVASKVLSEYIEDPKPMKVDTPRVYIYNTHQTENYSYKKYEEYNITPNVMMASYILREKLNKSGIPTIVEVTNIKDLLNANGWSYASSYKASRFPLKETIKNNKSIDLIIDLHRDSISKSASTITIDGKKYAKFLFVVGREYKTYKNNLALSNKLNNKLKEKYPGITRGVMEKSGPGVNGVYNQDLGSNIVLIECGGDSNTLDEVMNSLDVLSEVIKEYIGELDEKRG